MKTTPLGKLTDIKTGKLDVNAGAEDGIYPFFTCASTPYKINQYAFDAEAILVAGNGDLNVKYYKGKFNAYQRTYVIQNKDKETLSMKYLYYFMETYMARLRRDAIGGIIKYIKLGHLTGAEIPLPSLDDQKRIAHLLGKVEGLIARRKQHLQQLDDLLKSIFLEMFGDPVRNEKGWDKPELKHFGKISTGNTPPRKDPSNYSSRHIEWIKTDNISADSVFISRAAEYLSETGVIKARTVTKGALMVACIAGSVESIGRAALTDRTVAFNQQINAIQPKTDVNPLFLYVLFKISKAYIQSHASKGMKKILTKGDFEKITMIKPPVELQNQFAAIIKKVDALKSRYQQSLTDLESLYGALSQNALKGELDLSRVVLPAEGPGIAEEEKPDIEEKQPMEPLFELPPPEELALLQTAEGRKSLLGEWLNAWLEHLGNAPFTAQAFMDAARQRLWELVEAEAPDWGVGEYDELKNWVFEVLEQGRLTQGYDDANNRVQITAVKGLR
jgi:type I restriction enzyme S subunit